MADLGSVGRVECDTCAGVSMSRLLDPTNCVIDDEQRLPGRRLQALAMQQRRDAVREVRSAD